MDMAGRMDTPACCDEIEKNLFLVFRKNTEFCGANVG
jgi:hypothetical protein